MASDPRYDFLGERISGEGDALNCFCPSYATYATVISRIMCIVCNNSRSDSSISISYVHMHMWYITILGYQISRKLKHVSLVLSTVVVAVVTSVIRFPSVLLVGEHEGHRTARKNCSPYSQMFCSEISGENRLTQVQLEMPIKTGIVLWW